MRPSHRIIYRMTGRTLPSALPAFPYGAVYFRKSNPPPEDWDRDYATAAQDGLNAFRHWFLWSAIEVAPGEYDWADYDRQLDLAAQHGMKTIIAEFTTTAPEWAWRQYAHASYQDATGRPAHSAYSASTVVGGFPGLCLDNEDARALAERFLTTLAERYRDHPGLGAYDVWNECNISRSYCYCPATIARFRDWLRARYSADPGASPEQALRAVAKAWYRPGYAMWDDVDAPRSLGPYPDSFDWLQFRIDNAYRLMRWRVDLLRRLDPHHPITAHGVAQTLTDHALGANDEWRAAAEVDSFGFTFIAARRGDEPWKHFHAVDLVRAGCRGKPFWHSEAQAGPLWLQPQVAGRPRDDGRIATAEDVRYWSLASFAGGATGWFCPRWRPLLDGPLFGAFGMYAMDGSRTPRSDMVGQLATWANDPKQIPLWQARPVRGDVAILFCPESNLFNQLQQGSTDWYAEAARGAYQGFFDLNVQPDWLHVDDLLTSSYPLVYLPYPIHLQPDTAQKLRAWVEQGGTLVSEGCPAYFGRHGRAGVVQPNLGLDAVFGAREQYVEFTPDISDDVTFTFAPTDKAGTGIEDIPGALHIQAFVPITGRAAGTYAEGYGCAGVPGGLPAVITHAFGKGRTLLIGTSPGAARHRIAAPVQRRGTPAGSTYHSHHLADVHGAPAQDRLAASSAFFRALLTWAGVTPHVQTTNPTVIARLHQDPESGALTLWALNPSRDPHQTALTLSAAWPTFERATPHWPAARSNTTVDGRTITLIVPARDAVVLALG